MATKKAQAASVRDGAMRLLDLFAGNRRSVIRYNPKTGRTFNEKMAASLDLFTEHLVGSTGLGINPIMDDSSVVFAAIDMDNHGQDEDLPIAAIEAKRVAANIPMILCRSKSGGVHAYVFFTNPVPAVKARTRLVAWATLLGYPGAEVFPKQVKLAGAGAGQSKGNHINLPYMSGADTIRWAFRGGKKLSLDEFADLANRSKISEDELTGMAVLEHAQAPPCIQGMLTKGVPTGHRNEAMYQTVIYLKKMDPDGFEARAVEMNGSMFDRPLPRAELMRTIGSAAKPDYSFRCGEEPAKSMCDRDACLKRKFGISKSEFDLLAATAEIPPFTGLIKYNSEPIRWEMEVDGHRVSNISTAQLLEWKFMREVVAERLMRVVPLIKNTEWERILQPLMQQVRVVDTPDDAGAAGLVRARLREFAARADLSSKGTNADERKSLLRGLPCVQMLDGERQVVFRSQDFVNFLKRTKAEELKGTNLWFAVKDIGIQHNRMRVGAANINVWYLPVEVVLADGDTTPDKPKFESKL